MASTTRPAIVFFDGLCNFCNGSVRFIFDHDRHGKFRFASLQSNAAHARLSPRGIEAGRLGSIVLVDGDKTYQKSEAVLRIARGLGSGWALLSLAAMILPRPLLDWIYDGFARHRYHWFGKSDVCHIPKPGLRERFVDNEDVSPGLETAP